MKKLLLCVLALGCAAVLMACGHPAATLPLEGGDPVADPAPKGEVTGQLAEYTRDHVDMALTIPDGWSWETVEEDGQAGLRFWKTEDAAVDFRLTCWTTGYGICGTGVTEETLTLSGGQTVWQYTEAFNDNVWVNIVFQNTPGSYVCAPSADGVMDQAAWDGCRDEVLAILGTAQIGRGILTEEEAIQLAKAQYDGEYDMAYGWYDAENGCWQIRFEKGAMGQTDDVRYVYGDGTVTDAAPCPEDTTAPDSEK